MKLCIRIRIFDEFRNMKYTYYVYIYYAYKQLFKLFIPFST